MVRKSFSKALFDENDPQARNAARDLAATFGLDEIIENSNQYGIDLLGMTKGKISVGIEVEVKHGWSGGDFPFSTIHLPERKEKFCNLDIPVIFCILSKDLKQAAIFGKRTVLNAEKVEVPNRFVKSGELFFDIPVSEVRFVEIGTPFVKNLFSEIKESSE
jgi:hypothetical protein